MKKTGFFRAFNILRKTNPDQLQRSLAYMSDPDAWLTQYLTGRQVSAGVPVTEREIMNVSSVYAAVVDLSKIVASLPLIVYKRLPDGSKQRAVDHPLYDLLHVAPNPEMNSFTFKEMEAAHTILYGNAYSEIVRANSGAVTALWPMLTWDVAPIRPSGWSAPLTYTYQTPVGRIMYPRDKILHIRGFSFDGIMGLRPIAYAGQSMGISIAADQFAAEFFANDGTPPGLLKTPNKLSEEAIKRLKKQWQDNHAGTSKHHLMAVLEEGLEYQQTSPDPEKTQLLLTRQHQIAEAARIFDIPNHMVGDLSRATYTNIEHQSLEFLIYKLRPLLVRIEQTMQFHLLTAEERKTYYIEFLVDALLRADVQSRWSSYNIGRQIGVLSANDIARMENMNPIPGGDERYVPLNWQPIGNAGDTAVEPVTAASIRSAPIEKRSAMLRYRIAKSYTTVFEDHIGRVVRKERKDIGEAVTKYLTTRDKIEFDAWLEGYYRNLPEFMQARISPVYKAFAEAVRGQVAEELNISDAITPQDEQFVKDYVDSYISRYVNDSRLQIGALLRESQANGQNPADMINERLDQWSQRRPGKEAMTETTRASNAMAKAFYVAAGVTMLRWVALGAETCDFCQQLDGKVVGVDRDFVQQGSGIEAGGSRLPVNGPSGHPPIHDGCVCQIVSG